MRWKSVTFMLAAALLTGGLAGVTVRTAAAGPPDCRVINPVSGTCVITVPSPGSPAGARPSPPPSRGVASHGSVECFTSLTHEKVPCHDPTYGWWNQKDGCYLKLVAPQPPQTDPIWQGHTDGAIYAFFCPDVVGRGTPGGVTWLLTPPRGFGGVLISPAELAQRAVATMQLRAVEIGIVPEPKPGSIGLVGMPTWMWTTPTPNTWGPITRTASAGGVTVTATAKVTTAVWRMGDGTTVNCTSPGMPYDDAYGRRDSPDCGHTYVNTSLGKPGDAYQVQATSYWKVEWAGGGQTGTINLDFTANTQIRMGEMQVLITQN